MRVVVVGAGVVGLCCAVRLAEDGHDVHVLARDLPLETTSSAAAAMWYPYRADPPERIGAWAAETYDELTRLASEDPTAGVRVRDGRELRRAVTPDPWWRSSVPSFRRLTGAERPPGWADGWAFATPVADMPHHLQWLVGRLERLGGTLTRTALSALPGRGVVVNCSGLAARRLADDPTLTPVRGQVLVLEQPARPVTEWLLTQDGGADPTYVVPRLDSVVVGGCAQVGAWDRRPDPELARAILARAVALLPELASAAVRGHRVGLRPGRPQVRLDVEQAGGATVVHCYGHGGSGVTLAWGCAGEVARTVRALG